MNAGDDTVGGESGMSTDEMGEESGADSSMGKVLLGCEFFFLGLAFL